eukprot:5365264-Pyramimonas_sp.AAC.1
MAVVVPRVHLASWHGGRCPQGTLASWHGGRYPQGTLASWHGGRPRGTLVFWHGGRPSMGGTHCTAGLGYPGTVGVPAIGARVPRLHGFVARAQLRCGGEGGVQAGGGAEQGGGLAPAGGGAGGAPAGAPAGAAAGGGAPARLCPGYPPDEAARPLVPFPGTRFPPNPPKCLALSLQRYLRGRRRGRR